MTQQIQAWSFSRWNVYRECPAKFFYKFIQKLDEPKSEAMERGSNIHKAGENYLKTPEMPVPHEYSEFLPMMQELKAMGAFSEQQWGFDRHWKPTSWFGKQTWLRVMLDAGVTYDDATADIIDFKTGKKWGDNSEQMELFAVATFCHVPDLEELNARLWYLDSGEEDIQTFTRDQVPELIEAWEDRVEPMMSDTVFAPRPNDKCKWCHFRASNAGPCQYG